MTKEDEVTFDAHVVCEYVRHWDTHKINEDVGRQTDATLREIEEANRSVQYGYEEEFNSLFTLSHFISDSTPAWIAEAVISVDGEVRRFPFNRGFLVFSSEVKISSSQYRNALRNSDGSPVEEGQYTDEQLIQVYKEFVVSTLADYAFLFSLSANIAKPGAFQFTKRYLFQNRQLQRKIGGTMNSLDRALDVFNKYSWPPISNLDVFNMWDWLERIPGFTSGEARSALGRAVGLLSYLLCDHWKDENELALVWALIGLEAIYGKGNIGLKSQLIEKTELFLGPRTTHKKEFGNMYDFRSRLVHGDKNFHFRGFEGGFESSFSRKLMDSEDFAVATLISTLQRMCMQGIDELNFRTIVG